MKMRLPLTGADHTTLDPIRTIQTEITYNKQTKSFTLVDIEFPLQMLHTNEDGKNTFFEFTIQSQLFARLLVYTANRKVLGGIGTGALPSKEQVSRAKSVMEEAKEMAEGMVDRLLAKENFDPIKDGGAALVILHELSLSKVPIISNLDDVKTQILSKING